MQRGFGGNGYFDRRGRFLTQADIRIALLASLLAIAIANLFG